jgi:DNA-binding response OmpR family regulator
MTSQPSFEVLVIDDDETLAKMLSEYLSSYGLAVVWARDGKAGLEKLAATSPDVVVLDVMLPGGLDGFMLLPRIRAISDVPVLMLTARGEEADRIVGLELGADDSWKALQSPRAPRAPSGPRPP